jgi:hypothetical protein
MMATPHHLYMTEAAQFTGGKAGTIESIFIGGVTYMTVRYEYANVSAPPHDRCWEPISQTEKRNKDRDHLPSCCDAGFRLMTAAGQGKLLTKDPLIGLSLSSATDSGNMQRCVTFLCLHPYPIREVL